MEALEDRIKELEEENAELRAKTAEEEPEETIMTEAPEEEPAEEEFEIASELEFSFTDQFPKIWGNVKIVDPLLVGFSDILVEKGFFLLDDNEVRVTGKIFGLDTISYTLFPEKGCFTMLSAVIFDDSGNIKWEQDGYPIEDSYISENETRDFLLINKYEEPIDYTDKLTIIAYLEGGMLEDLQADNQIVDKGVFGLNEGTCRTLDMETEDKELVNEEKEEVQEEPEEKVGTEIETQTPSNIQPFIDSASDNLGNINTNSWAKGSGGDWSSGGLDASPTIYIGDTLTFAINVSNSSNLQYRFQYQPPGGSFITIQDWSSSSGCAWAVPSNAFGQWAVVNVQVRNDDGLNFQGFCDDYTYLTYVVLSR